MRLIGIRPLCTLCLLALFSAMLGIVLPGAWAIWLWLIAAVGIVLVIVAGLLHWLDTYTVCMAVLLLFVVPLGFGCSSHYYAGTVARIEAQAGEVCVVEGLIVERGTSAGHQSNLILQADAINGEKISTKLRLDCDFPANTRVGERISVTGLLEAHPVDDHGFAARRYYLAQGVAATLTLENSEQITVRERNLVTLPIAAGRLSVLLEAKLKQAAGERAGGFLSALLLGRREALADSTVRNFKRLGLSHLLALSGMHLTLLSGVVGWILLHLHIPRKLRCILQLLLVWGFVLLTGAPGSMLRAACMLTFSYAVAFCAEYPDAMTSLWCSATVICLINPASLLDLGLWMSVFATLGLLVCADLKFARLPQYARGPARAVLATLTANLLTLPFVALVDGELSKVVLLSNLIFIPLTSLLLYLAPLVLVLPFLGTPSAAVVEFTLQTAARMAHPRGIAIALQNAGVFWFLLPLMVIGTLLLIYQPWQVAKTKEQLDAEEKKQKTKKSKKRSPYPALAFALAVILCAGGAVIACLPRGADLIYCRSESGTAEAIALYSPDGVIVCDIGLGYYETLYTAYRYAAKLGATEIETLMLTHYHTAHIDTVEQMLDSCIVRHLLLPEPATDREREIVTDLLEIARSREVEAALYPDGAPILLGDFTLVPHTRSRISRSNQPLVLLRIAHGETKMTYLGASLGESELASTASAYAADSRYLILGAHGPNPKTISRLPALTAAEHIYAATENALAFLLPVDTSVPVSLTERVRIMLD